ncbi:hypothetical protein ACFPB0_14565 [Glycocaulis abyssi]|uniref:Uncharacterized protein n=1 Tax=Glycocaulis abyssi TaxID=1433403 RepID=A0ABV9NDV2_9PROT
MADDLPKPSESERHDDRNCDRTIEQGSRQPWGHFLAGRWRLLVIALTPIIHVWPPDRERLGLPFWGIQAWIECKGFVLYVFEPGLVIVCN